MCTPAEPLRQSRPVTVRTGALAAHVGADATRLRQVMLNRLCNAIKYKRDGGEVSIEAEPRGDHVILRVADNDRGMTAEQMRHLFEAFNRLGAEGEGIEGTGIGLAIVKALTERMGGTVQAPGVPGRGRVFPLQLQAVARAGGESPAPPRMPRCGLRRCRRRRPGPSPLPDVPPAAPAKRRQTLLHVEDNAVNALIIRELLASRADVELHVAVDGASGVEQAAQLLPDLILPGMQLPDCDGFEMLRRLRARPATALIPCAALSANAMPGTVERALAAGPAAS